MVEMVMVEIGTWVWWKQLVEIAMGMEEMVIVGGNGYGGDSYGYGWKQLWWR